MASVGELQVRYHKPSGTSGPKPHLPTAYHDYRRRLCEPLRRCALLGFGCITTVPIEYGVVAGQHPMTDPVESAGGVWR